VSEERAAISEATASTAFTLVAVAVAVAAAMLRLANDGWGVLLLGPFYLAILIGHVIVHRKAGTTPSAGLPHLASIALSHIVLVCAFLLQWDQGDSSVADLTLVEVLNLRAAPPTWIPQWLSVPALGAVLLSWAGALVSRRRGSPARAGLALNAVNGTVMSAIVVVASLQVYGADRALSDAAVQRAGGRPPASCGDAPLPVLRSDQVIYDGAIGTAPVWLYKYPFTTRNADVLLERLGNSADGRVQTKWLVDPGYAQTISVTILDPVNDPLRSNQFGVGRGTTQTLDPAKPFTKAGRGARYSEYVIEFFIPRAGCYSIRATWPEGSWNVPLAAGQ
jgi:hypothetical protein